MRPEEDAVILGRVLGVAAGFTPVTVRVAMIRAIADLRPDTAEFTPLRWTDYQVSIVPY